MKHNEKAVEDMARYLFEDIHKDVQISYRGVATRVLDAMVPQGYTAEQIRTGDCVDDEVKDHIVCILNGTANLGGDDGTR